MQNRKTNDNTQKKYTLKTLNTLKTLKLGCLIPSVAEQFSFLIDKGIF